MVCYVLFYIDYVVVYNAVSYECCVPINEINNTISIAALFDKAKYFELRISDVHRTCQT